MTFNLITLIAALTGIILGALVCVLILRNKNSILKTNLENISRQLEETKRQASADTTAAESQDGLCHNVRAAHRRIVDGPQRATRPVVQGYGAERLHRRRADAIRSAEDHQYDLDANQAGAESRRGVQVGQSDGGPCGAVCEALRRSRQGAEKRPGGI